MNVGAVAALVYLMNALMKWFPKWDRFSALVFCVVVFFGVSGRALMAQSEAAVVREHGQIRVEAPAGLESYAASVMSHATAALRILNQATGDNLLASVRFIVAADHAEFTRWAGGQSETSLAVSLGGQQTVVISRPAMQKSGPDKIQQVLAHELAHVYLDVRCKGDVPRWVHEGVAQIVAGEWTNAPGDGAMALAAYTGGLLELSDLVDGFPVDEVQRRFAYAESYSALRYVVRTDHGNSLRNFLKEISGDEGRAYLRSLSEGPQLAELQSRWRGELRSPLFVTTLFLGSGLFWGFAAMLALVAYFVVKRRGRKLREAWSQEEIIDRELGLPPSEAEWTEEEWVNEEDPDGEAWKRGS